MSEENKETRSNRHKKRGQSNMVMKLAVGLIGLIAIIFLLEFFIGGSDNDTNPDRLVENNGNEQSSMIVQDESEEDTSGEEAESSSEAESEPEETPEEDGETREITSNDPNVIRAFAGDWQPVGTNQSEPHVTNYSDGSADRIEIKRASALATGVGENDMIEHWIGNNGDQKVTATISEISSGMLYKVYLTWISNEGWQVTHFEEIYEIIE